MGPTPSSLDSSQLYTQGLQTVPSHSFQVCYIVHPLQFTIVKSDFKDSKLVEIFFKLREKKNKCTKFISER